MLRTMPSSKSTNRPAAIVPDERQREAIEHVRGPMLVVAGAGTGKTTVLTRRLARLIRDGHARPDEILALTYADNSATEMRERVQAELRGTDISGLRTTTFHAYGNELLKSSARGFGVLDDKDLWIYLRKRLPDLHLNYFVRAANVAQFLDDLLDFMRRCHDELVGPEKYAEYVQRLERGELPIPRVTKSRDAETVTDQEVLGRCREIAAVFTTVERMLHHENLGTFSHMITRSYELLRQDSELLAREQRRARFILVDEFQDANFAQVKILSALAGEERNIFAVGDPDQAIYRFRGASSAAFGLFQRHFSPARMVVLEKNQRSTTPILQCAFPLSGRDFEAADIVAVIEEKRRPPGRWGDCAVLYRSHFHRDEIARELGEKGIPFIIENMDVMDTSQVRDLLACLGAVDSTADAASLLRAAALPLFGIDPEKFRAAMRVVPRGQKDGRPVTMASLLNEIDGGPAVLSALQKARQEITRTGAKSRAALEIIVGDFGLDRNSPPLEALLKFVEDWEKKAITKTGDIGELLDYLQYFREARGAVCL